MKIGIIGVGIVTLNLALRAVKAGHEVLINHTQCNHILKDTIDKIEGNVKLVTKYEAATAEIVILFISCKDLERSLSELPEMKGKVLLHTNNPIFNLESFLPVKGTKSSCQTIASLFPTSHVVKIFNILEPAIILPYRQEPKNNEIFYTGNNLLANIKVKNFLESLHFSALDIEELYESSSLN